MDNKALFLFIILVLGLILCSVLGSKYNREGMTSGSNAGTVTLNSGVFNNTTPYTGATGSSGSTGSNSATNASNQSNSYDNYNHYNGNSYPTTFYGPNGGTATFSNAYGQYSITVTNSNGTTIIYTNNAIISNGTPGIGAIANQTLYSQAGGSVRIFTNAKSQYALEVTQANGNTIIYTANNNYTYNYSQNGNSGSTGNNTYPYSNNVQSGFEYSRKNNYNYYENENNGGAGAGPNSLNENGIYNSTMPRGIPRSMIPLGQEDLYILKSEIVPPVCPAPATVICPKNDNSKCPPCPAPKRCKEPSYDCKLVPNYYAGNKHLPRQVTPYSTFGM